MVPPGLFPVLAAVVKLILIPMNTVECRGIGPIPSDVHSHGVPGNEQAEGKNVLCNQGHYLHPNRTHCCMLCHKGTYIAQHCMSEDRKPDCISCPEGSFMDSVNFAEKCRGCQKCRSSLGQVMLTICSSTQDTVCGCPSNYYRTSKSSEFLCKPCSACHNGTILKECSEFSDTVCKCRKEFFLQTKKNSCSPCSSCQGEECKDDCDVRFPSRSPPDSPDLTPILSCLVAVFAAGILFMAVKKLLKSPVRKKLISAFSIFPSEQQTLPADLQLPQPKVQEEKLLSPDTPAVPGPPNTQGLPDCIQPAGETQIPDRPEVLYAVVENVPFGQWKEFVRRLGLSENDICRILVEESNMRDAQYKMLKLWRQQSGPRATVERMSSVLKEMELGGCSEAIQEVLSRQA